MQGRVLEPELELALALALALVLVLVLDTLGTRPVAAPQRALPLLLAAEPGSSQLRELRLVGRHTRALLLQGGMMVELEGHKKRPQQVQQVLQVQQDMRARSAGQQEPQAGSPRWNSTWVLKVTGTPKGTDLT